MKQWTFIGVEEDPLGLWVTTGAVNGKGMFCAGSTEDGKQQGPVGKGFSPLERIPSSWVQTKPSEVCPGAEQMNLIMLMKMAA